MTCKLQKRKNDTSTPQAAHGNAEQRGTPDKQKNRTATPRKTHHRAGYHLTTDNENTKLTYLFEKGKSFFFFTKKSAKALQTAESSRSLRAQENNPELLSTFLDCFVPRNDAKRRTRRDE